MIEPRRSAPGESWRRAMELVAERRAAGSKKRYQVYGYQVAPGWWAYSIRRAGSRRVPPPKADRPVRPMDAETLERLGRDLPRCAQRARASHGGGSKLALPSAGLAWRVAEYLGGKSYRCTLPAPAIGEHWHVTTERRRKR